MADPAFDPTSVPALVIAAGAVAGSLYAVARYVVRPIARAIAVIAGIGVDWFGQVRRPGHKPVPGVMERLASIEHEVHEDDGYSMKDRLNQLTSRASENADAIARVESRQYEAVVASEAAAEKAVEAAEKAEVVGERLATYIEDTQVRAETYLHILREVHDIDLEPGPRDPETRERRDDT